MNSGFQADFNNTHIKKLLCCLSTILRWLLHILRIICYFEHLKYMNSHSMLSPKKSFGKPPPPLARKFSLMSPKSWIGYWTRESKIGSGRSAAKKMKWKGGTTDAARPTIWWCMLCRRYSIWIRNIQYRLLYTR